MSNESPPLLTAEMAENILLARLGGEPLDPRREIVLALRALASGKTECRVVGAVGVGERHAFKNFHRNLCERFGYVHDERDWERDQCSLIEHIAALSAARGRVVGGKDVAGLRERLEVYAHLASVNGAKERGLRAECFPDLYRLALALLERAAPLHEQRLAVGRDGLQHDAASRASLSTPVPLTNKENFK